MVACTRSMEAARMAVHEPLLPLAKPLRLLARIRLPRQGLERSSMHAFATLYTQHSNDVK